MSRFLALCLVVLLAPNIIPPSDWGSKPQPLDDSLRQTPRRIVVHHAGVVWHPHDDPYQKLRNLQAWGQREKNWPDLPYHYLITPDGRIFAGRDQAYRPESNTNYPLDGVINVQVFGDYEQQILSLPALESLVELLVELCRQHSIHPSTIVGHRQAAPGQTTCPGQDLDRYVRGPLRDWVRAGLDQQTVPVRLLPRDWFLTPDG